MKWYVLNWDFNGKRLENYNIFQNAKFNDGVKELLEKGVGEYEVFVEELTSLARYCFWCKAEYEIMIGDLFVKDVNELTKVDIYSQIVPNIERIADYILGSNM